MNHPSTTPDEGPSGSQRLAAIWFADIVGYSSLSARDEAAALRLVALFQRASRESIAAVDGRLVKFIGDAALAVFSGTEQAVRSALLLRTRFAKLCSEEGLPGRIRVGVHVGDITSAADGDIYGDGVNTASRVQSAAEPDEILTSEDVWRHLRVRQEVRFVARGRRRLKGLPHPVPLFAVYDAGDPRASAAPGSLGRVALALTPSGLLRAVEPAIADPGTGRLRKAAFAGMLAVTLLTLGAGVVFAARALGIGGARSLAAEGLIGDGSAVLLADFSSGTDAEVGDVVTRILRVDLVQSPLIRVIDRAELDEPLARMNLPSDTRLTSEVATQLAEREGYAAIITGEVARAGTGYILTAGILAGEGLRPVAALRETARNDDELIDGIERLARAIRDRAGESLKSVRASPPLAQVTTTSLPALRAYTRGAARFQTGDYAAALEHYTQAISLDSNFAMAYNGLASSLIFMRVRRDDVVRAHRRLLELRDRLPPVERRLAVASYHLRVDGDVERAIEAFDAVVAIDSTNVFARNQLGILATRLGRYAEAERHLLVALTVRPAGNLWTNLALLRLRRDGPEAALATLDTGAATLPEWNGSDITRALIHFTAHDFERADTVIRQIEADGNPRTRQDARLGRFALEAVRGRLRAAERALDGPADFMLADAVVQASLRAQLLLIRGDSAGAVRMIRRALATHTADDDSYPNVISVLAAAGDGDAAAAALDEWRARTPADQLGVAGAYQREFAAGVVRRAQRDFGGALVALEESARRLPGAPGPALHALARTFDGMGDAASAAAAYERALTGFGGGFTSQLPQIVHAFERLGRLHEAQGDRARAVEWYGKFAELWKDADPELQPRVREARQRIRALGG